MKIYRLNLRNNFVTHMKNTDDEIYYFVLFWNILVKVKMIWYNSYYGIIQIKTY